MKITGPTSEYTAALLNNNDALNSLIKLLSAFDVKFRGSQFIYEPADTSIVLAALPLASALAIEPAATPRGFVIKGYPWSLKISDTAMAASIPNSVSDWFPYANDTDNSDPDNPVVTRNTFGEAVAEMTNYSTHKSTSDDETCIANLGIKLDSLTYAVALNAISGVTVITLDEYNTFVADNQPS